MVIVVPTLLGLATELALKALHMREEGTIPRSHDLLELFDRLSARTRRRLAQKMPGVPELHPDLPSVYPGIREVLEANRTLFVEWRHLHERPHLSTETSMLKEALSAIIDAFEDGGTARRARLAAAHRRRERGRQGLRRRRAPRPARGHRVLARLQRPGGECLPRAHADRDRGCAPRSRNPTMPHGRPSRRLPCRGW